MNQMRRLAMIFCRPMTGVHNRTWGPIMDMMSPMMMSMLRMSTPTSRALHAEMRCAMMNPMCNKVVMMAHGSGAAILSQVLDEMLCEMPQEMMAKLEIYTFGSAAHHLNNPCMLEEREGMMGNMMPGMGMNKSGNGVDMMMGKDEMPRVIPVSRSIFSSRERS